MWWIRECDFDVRREKAREVALGEVVNEGPRPANSSVSRDDERSAHEGARASVLWWLGRSHQSSRRVKGEAATH